MPFPFFAHQAAALPFKLRWPMLSGTGLVLGSMAPDFGYFLIGQQVSRAWHRPHGVLLFCLPVSFMLYLFVTRVIAAPIARHLPRTGTFRLHHLAYLEAQPRTGRHLLVVAACIVVGAMTHLGWDLFTHDGTWMGDRLPWLRMEVLRVGDRRIIGTSVLWIASTLAGGAFTLAVLHEMGRRDLWRGWAETRLPGSTHGIDPEAPAATSHVAFWGPAVSVTLGMAVLAYATRPSGFHPGDKATWVIVFLRAVTPGFATLALCAWRERRAWRHHSPAASDAPRAVDPAA